MSFASPKVTPSFLSLAFSPAGHLFACSARRDSRKASHVGGAGGIVNHWSQEAITLERDQSLKNFDTMSLCVPSQYLSQLNWRVLLLSSYFSARTEAVWRVRKGSSMLSPLYS